MSKSPSDAKLEKSKAQVRTEEWDSGYDLQLAKVEMYTLEGEGGTKNAIIPPRKRGRPARNSDYEWDEEETFRLIELWSKEELLYNTSDVFYLHRDFRSQALTNIFKTLVDEGVDLSSPMEVRNKMNNLRNYYAAEKRKERRNANNLLPYKSSWKFFKSLYFLEDNYRPRETAEDVFVDNNSAPSTLDTDSAPSMVQRTSSSHLEGGYEEEARIEPRTETRAEPVKKRRRAEQAPVNSFMTVFRKAKRNSKVVYSMDQSDNTIIETRPVVRNTAKSFAMNRTMRPISQDEPSTSPQSHQQQRRSDVGKFDRFEIIDHTPHSLKTPVENKKPNEAAISNTPHQTSTTPASSETQNLDKCYTDLIYQILVTMPDTVEKAMLKLDFQQKLIKLKYSQKD